MWRKPAGMPGLEPIPMLRLDLKTGYWSRQ
jgi:hypothetical protein